MKNIIVFLLLFVVLASCGNAKNEADAKEGVSEAEDVVDSFFAHSAFDGFNGIAYLSAYEIGSMLTESAFHFPGLIKGPPCDILQESAFYILNIDTTSGAVWVKAGRGETDIFPVGYPADPMPTKKNRFKITNASIEITKDRFYMCRLISLDKGLKGGCMASFELVKTFDLNSLINHPDDLRLAIFYIAFLFEEGRYDEIENPNF